MSENSNEKQLHNRLKSIFSDLHQTHPIPGLSINSRMSGWFWEIDPQGTLTACSPDVHELLGYSSETMVAQPLGAYSDFNLNAANLPKNPTIATLPIQIELTYKDTNNAKVETTSYLLPIINEDNQFLGWRGMSVIPLEDQDLQAMLIQEDEEAGVQRGLPLPDIFAPDEVLSPDPDRPGKIRDRAGIPQTNFEEETAFEEPLIPAVQPSEAVLEFLKMIDDDPDKTWEADDIQLVEQVHSQLELALENANLFQQTQIALAETDEQARRLRLLNELSEKLSQATNLYEIYNATTETTAEMILNADYVSLLALTTEDNTSLEVCGLSGKNTELKLGMSMPLKDSPSQIAFNRSTILILDGIDAEQASGEGSLLVAPIFIGGEPFGTLNLGSQSSNRFRDQDRYFMQQLITLVNASIENRRLFDAIENALSSTEEQARRLAELNQLSEQLGQTETFEEVISTTMQRIDMVIPCEFIQTTILDRNTNQFRLYNLQDGKALASDQTIPLEGSLLGEVVKHKRLVSEYNLKKSPYPDTKALIEQHHVHSLIAAPLLTGDDVLGTLMVATQKEAAYTLQEETLMQSISSIVASTVENRRLFQQIQRRSLQLETSAEVSRFASTILDPEELLPEVVNLITTGFNLYYTGLFLVDETGEITGEPNKWAVLRAGSGEAGHKMLEANHKLEVGGSSMIGTCIANAEARIALDVGAEAQFFRNPYLPNTRSEMALPLISRGQVLGALSIQSLEEAAFSQEDITSLQTLADQLANAIENARLFEQTEERAEELAVLNEMARAFTQTMNVDKLIEFTYEFSGRLMNTENFYMALFHPEKNLIEFKYFVEDGVNIPPPEPKIMLGEGLTDWIITNKLPMLMPNNAQEHMRQMGIPARGRPAAAWLGVPMLLGNQVMGVIAVQSYDPEVTFNSQDLDLLSAVASQAAVAIDNASRFEATQARARYEQVLREITTRVHSSSSAETILRTAVREVSNALGRQAFIELKDDLEENRGSLETQPAKPASEPQEEN